MLIKEQALSSHIKNTLLPVYFLIGQENYLITRALETLKNAFKKAHDCEEHKIGVQSPKDWLSVEEEAVSYSLFAETVLLDVTFEKKTLDTQGKSFLAQYLKAPNPRCLILVQAPQLPMKQLQSFSSHPKIAIVNAQALESQAMRTWIHSQLKAHGLQFDAHIPDIIFQYTEGNMLGCAQLFDKIRLTVAANSHFTEKELMQHLKHQPHYDVFHLGQTCLLGDSQKVLHMVRYAEETKAEPTLVLWTLSQEIRTLLELAHLVGRGATLNDACQQLQIWSSRISLYQKCYQRIQSMDLKHLLRACQTVDNSIKTNDIYPLWQSLESIALSLSMGRLVGNVCKL